MHTPQEVPRLISGKLYRRGHVKLGKRRLFRIAEWWQTPARRRWLVETTPLP